jgi:hypothetical protein
MDVKLPSSSNVVLIRQIPTAVIDFGLIFREDALFLLLIFLGLALIFSS